jgi:hypothetical protein
MPAGRCIFAMAGSFEESGPPVKLAPNAGATHSFAVDEIGSAGQGRLSDITIEGTRLTQ